MADRSLEDALALLVADVYELAGTLRRSGDGLAGEVGQSQARWQLLSVLSEGEWTVPTAARRLGVTRQAVQRVADVLAAEGHVRFADNPAHRRSSRVELTASGRKILGRITESSRRWRGAVAAGLSVAEIERTRRLLKAVRDHVRASGQSEPGAEAATATAQPTRARRTTARR